MASIAVTDAWSDPTSGLTTGSSYIVQNKSSGVVQFFEGATFDATTNANDGILLVPLHDGGSGHSDLRWTYDSGNAIRIRVSGAIPGATGSVEFAPAA